MKKFMPHSFHIICKVRGKINWENEHTPLNKKVQGKRNILGTVRGGGTGEVKDGLFSLGQIKVEEVFYKKGWDC